MKILLANSSLNFDLNLGTEMVSEPINDPTILRNNLHIPLSNNNDYISDEEFEVNSVPTRYFE